MTENKGNLSGESSSILKKLIDMNPEDINLKYIFDHIRNYGIASTMMIAGLYLWKHPESAFGMILIFSEIWSLLLILLGLFLNVLNLTQVIWVLAKVKMPLGIFIFLMFFIFYIVLSFLASYAKYFMSIS
ncbi:TPA: hypothetical protein PPD39_003728 [Acinetobacter baumannii]|uniref:hypothetical protein n=1 Tax=Acinetobacter TaxID=469 RepID=UPI000707CDA8|nr:hypothetical protein [Acinetobacter baumannii]KQE43693.1 hypothetical protein APD45_07600 [Acinetobacter baumannii]MBC6818456.1 hypothetical protein [Acinetobacter baumannii]MCA4386457.1 hypothetical protein [Acinetobacter baumannii]MCQ1078353.1 hypothetical protein [Acinetobacter baumannii]MCQ1078367.1 hypothetical protein [Acinetobacter baumannii]